MRSLSRIVWSEGMHLAQHHFQGQSRYFESFAAFLVGNLFFKPFGVITCALDGDALRNGSASLIHASGIFPDGLAFHVPDDPAPAPIDLNRSFSPTHDSHLVLLAIPGYRPQRSNCTTEPGRANGEARYVETTATVSDEMTGVETKPVAFAAKNLRLLLDVGEADPALVSLPLARVRRDGSGHFVFDEDYVPPCLQIDASLRLMQILTRLVQLLESKADSLVGERRGTPGDAGQYGQREIVGYWLSHAMHSALGPLRHQLHVRTGHPATLYAEMARLAGALCSFGLDANPLDVPAYDHDRLDRTFGELDAFIRSQLDVVLPTAPIRIRLLKTAEYLYTARIDDPRCLVPSRWYLGVRSSGSESEVIARIPTLAKVCSARLVDRLVKEGLPGLVLAHIPLPPASLAPRIGTTYFSVQTAGDPPCWQSIVASGEIGVYVPGAMGDIELELTVLPAV